MKKLTTLTAALMLAAALMIAGCASLSRPSIKDPMDTQRLIDAAASSIKKAASVGGEWLDSSNYLRQAEAALKAGNITAAARLANKAKAEGDMSYEQAQSQKKAGPWLF